MIVVKPKVVESTKKPLVGIPVEQLLCVGDIVRVDAHTMRSSSLDDVSDVDEPAVLMAMRRLCEDQNMKFVVVSGRGDAPTGEPDNIVDGAQKNVHLKPIEPVGGTWCYSKRWLIPVDCKNISPQYGVSLGWSRESL